MANPSGPTLNPEYNGLLVKWGKAHPECEECGKDTTGMQMFDTGTMWVGECCHEAEDEIDYDEEFERERGWGRDRRESCDYGL